MWIVLSHRELKQPPRVALRLFEEEGTSAGSLPGRIGKARFLTCVHMCATARPQSVYDLRRICLLLLFLCGALARLASQARHLHL